VAQVLYGGALFFTRLSDAPALYCHASVGFFRSFVNARLRVSLPILFPPGQGRVVSL
jgi:hypothetical protein